MKYDALTLKAELEAASGIRPADILFENVQLVDVYTDEIRKANIAVFGGKIIGVGEMPHIKANERIDCEGMYAMPGFMDTHVHIETTLLTPGELAKAIVAWGTTTMFVDAMEIANVAGMEGLKALVSDSEDLPFRIFLEIPSRVPTAPGLETAGAQLDAAEVEQLLRLKNAVSLGELDPSKILGIREEYLQKVVSALELGKICNGHAIGLTPPELNIYATAHLADDHESVTVQELIDRLRVGMKALIREGSSERNTKELITGVLEHKLPTENLMFCTDDKHINDIFAEGHISYSIQTAIDLGMDPVTAIKIATINAAKHFRLEHMIGSLTPGRQADIVFVRDIRRIVPEWVYKDGKPVAKGGAVLPCAPKAFPEELFHTVRLGDGFCKGSFAIRCAEGKAAKCRVISMVKDQIINNLAEEWMPVSAGEIHANTERDILKLAVVERHGKNGRVSAALVTGFGLKRGAIASSVSHDHHNIVVAGCNDEDMYLAVKELERLQGGFAAAADGKVLDSIALPLAGLMSTMTAEEVMTTMERVNAAARSLGCEMNAPFMSLSFISLPTVPELGLTDYGLIDVLKHCIIDLVVETSN